jgi:hypothetical protein
MPHTAAKRVQGVYCTIRRFSLFLVGVHTPDVTSAKRILWIVPSNGKYPFQNN